MGFGGFLKKIAKPITKVAEKIVKPLRPIVEMAGLLPELRAVDTGEGEPLSEDPAGIGKDAKPLEMPTMDSAVVEEARRRALLKRQQAGGRRSTILADKRY